MTHLKRKLMMTLALLLTAATSAWAESKPIGLNVEYAVGDVITTNSTGDVYVWWGIYSEGGENYEWVIKITSSVTPTISELRIVESSGSIKLDKAYAVYDMNGNIAAKSYSIQCQGEVTGTLEKVHVVSGSGTLADPYVFAPGPAASAATTVPLTWDATAKTATLTNGMPAGNVTVSVEYFPQAEFAKSTDATPIALAPTAIADVPANTDAPIVTPGTVANIGTSEVPQGTLMYFVKQADGNTAPVAPTYDTDGWTDKVPTANGLKQGDAYVWYYIKGAEPANIADRTDDNTRSDSDIKPLGTSGYVTLAAEPTYDVSLNKTGLDDGEPAKWSAKSTNVAAVNLGTNDLEGVKKGETVTVTYTGSKKVIGVKAEKKATTPAEGKTYTNLQGGEVLHVGDKITETEGKFRYTHHSNPQSTDYYSYIQSFNTYEVLRADVAYEDYNYKYTESPDGQYYVLKCTYFDDYEEEWFTAYYFNQDLPVTGTSDGITVTLDGQDGSQRNLYTFWVHEPNQ